MTAARTRRRAAALAAAALALALGLGAARRAAHHAARRDDYPYATADLLTRRVVDLTDRPAADPRRARPDDPIWRYPWASADDEGVAARWYARQVLARVDARPGMRIADVGAGAGWFTFRFAQAVGPTGAVVATDMDLRMAQLLAFTRRQRGAANVRVLHVPAEALGLAAASVDVVVMVNVGLLHDRQRDPAEVRRSLADVADALRPGGRLVYATQFNADPRRHRAAAEVAALAAERFTVAQLDEAPVEHAQDDPRPVEGYVLTLRRRGPP